MRSRSAMERFAARVVRVAVDAAARVVADALAARDRRGERSIQLARVTLVRPHPVLVTAITHVEVECVGNGLSLVACLSQPLRGMRADVVIGDLVLVAVPRGALDDPAVIVGVVSTGTAPQPQLTLPTNALWEHLLGVVEVRAPLGVWINGPGQPAARQTDPVSINPDWEAWLQGLATAAEYGAPMPEAPIGAISGGSATVQIGG